MKFPKNNWFIQVNAVIVDVVEFQIHHPPSTIHPIGFILCIDLKCFARAHFISPSYWLTLRQFHSLILLFIFHFLLTFFLVFLFLAKINIYYNFSIIIFLLLSKIINFKIENHEIDHDEIKTAISMLYFVWLHNKIQLSLIWFVQLRCCFILLNFEFCRKSYFKSRKSLNPKWS